MQFHPIQQQGVLNTGAPAMPYFPPTNFVGAPPTYTGTNTASITPYQRNNSSPSPNLMGRATPDLQPKGAIEDLTNVFIASLPNFYDDKMLFELFQPYGTIVSAKVSRDLNTGHSRSFGFVRFESPEAASRAIGGLNDVKLKGVGTKLHVTLSHHNENGAAECDRLYIRNLPLTATSENLREIFRPFGTVLEANIQANGQSGASRAPANLAVGFVRMASVEEAKLALAGVHGTYPFSGAPTSPILVRYMETPDMKVQRKNKNSETASGRNSANRNSPDPFAGSSSSHPGQPPAYNNNPIPFPTYGDLFVQGASAEQVVQFVFGFRNYVLSQILYDPINLGFYVRLVDPSQHEKATADLNLAVLSDNSILRVATLAAPAQQLPLPHGLDHSQSISMMAQPPQQ